jgi:hypothetical protein
LGPLRYRYRPCKFTAKTTDRDQNYPQARSPLLKLAVTDRAWD